MRACAVPSGNKGWRMSDTSPAVAAAKHRLIVPIKRADQAGRRSPFRGW